MPSGTKFLPGFASSFKLLVQFHKLESPYGHVNRTVKQMFDHNSTQICKKWKNENEKILFAFKFIYTFMTIWFFKVLFCCYRSEYSAFWKCVQAGGAYLFTQLCKMLVLATFFPTTEVPTGSLDILGVRIYNIHISQSI